MKPANIKVTPLYLAGAGQREIGGQACRHVVVRSGAEMLVGKKASDGESVSDTLALLFCFDVHHKTLRTKAYVIVNWGPFHVTVVLRAIVVFHFDY